MQKIKNNNDCIYHIIEEKITNHPNINLIRERVDRIPEGNVIIATGPLTSEVFASEILKICENEDYFGISND